jgi:hypothetical protein
VPSFSIEKLQRIGGESGSFTTSPLTGEVGQTVEYEIIVQNTGNVPLKFNNFYDPHCDPATVAGGPGEAALAPGLTTSTGASSTYTCDHVLTRADQSTGSYRNYASDVATPPPNAGVPIPKSSNTVVVNLLVTPSFSIEKLQRIATVGGSFTTSPLTGEVGQTVEYEIVVTNTGNVPLKFSAFSDTQCDAGTISGGPGATALALGGSSTYVCHHVLTSADQSAGSYSNVASDTATAAVGEGSAITLGSNTVVVGLAQVAAPPNPQPPSPGPNAPSSSGSPASSSSSGASSPSSGAERADSGVLAFTAATVPSLHAPQGCVRSSFHVHLNAAGVAHATFYLDGHRLKTLTSRNARNGVLTIVIDPATLSVGAHRLKAEITMARKASTSQAAKASRTAIVLRCRATVSTPKFTG